MLFIVALAVLIGLMAYWSNRWWDSDKKDIHYEAFAKTLAKAFAIVIPLLIVEAIILSAVIVIPAGHRGVIFDKFSGVQAKALGEGFNFVVPYLQDVYQYDVRVQKAEFSASAASKDLQIVSTKVALNFRPRPESVGELHRNVGLDYAEKVIHPAVQEAVKATTARYTAEELITKREDVKKHIQELLVAQAAPANIEVTETYIIDFDFSSEFAHAVESKQIAEQQAFKAKRDLDRIRIEADQKIATAQAEAKSLMLQREAITSNLIELRRIEAQRLAIEKWDGRLPQTMMGNSTPIIDLSSVNGTKR